MSRDCQGTVREVRQGIVPGGYVRGLAGDCVTGRLGDCQVTVREVCQGTVPGGYVRGLPGDCVTGLSGK